MGNLRIELRVSEGSLGVETDANNPFALAFHRLLQDGKPFNSFALCFYGGEEGTKAEELRWLGAFVDSASGHILYVPGFDLSVKCVQVYDDQGFVREANFSSSHVTLEKTLRRSHITSPSSEGHMALGLQAILETGDTIGLG